VQYPAAFLPSASRLFRRLARHSRRTAPLLLAMAALAGCNRVELPTAEGDVLEWQSMRGQWVVVNYWAEWCKPCLEEIPELNALDEQSAVTVLGVNFDGVGGDDLVALGDTMGIRYAMLTTDPGPAPNGAVCLVALDGAAVTATEVGGLARACIIFDGDEPAALETARAQWRALTRAGVPAQYWAEDGGRWRKKSEYPGGTAG